MTVRISLFFDPRDERWPSMDLVGDMLLGAFKETLPDRVVATGVEVSIPRVIRRLGRVGRASALNADRLLARFVVYPTRALRERATGGLFHVVDHSYAQLVHVLPAARTGVYCHDLDAFRCLVEPEREPRPAWFRGMTRVVLSGMQRAAIVFHSTMEVRRQIEGHGLVDRRRLVHAPYGVGPEFAPGTPRTEEVRVALAPLAGAPYLLHVGSSIPRKRLDVLFEAFARVLTRHPEMWLVQQGGQLNPAQRTHAERLGISHRLLQPPTLSRRSLAALYGGAVALLLPSEAEGFGFPIVEALACDCPVVASDLPVLREVGGDAVLYARTADADAFASRAEQIIVGHATVAGPDERRARAALFTWRAHANTILDAYLNLLPRLPPAPTFGSRPTGTASDIGSVRQ